MEFDDSMPNKPATMVTPEGNSLLGGMIDKPSVENDMYMAQAGGASSEPGQMSGKTTWVSFAAACDKWKSNQNWKWLQNETSEPVSTPGDWVSRME
jgi:hypothetical protein